MTNWRNPPKHPLDHDPAAVTYAREQAGLTQKQLAEACGVGASLISEIESGTRNATPEMLNKVSTALGCPRIALERGRSNGDIPPCGTKAAYEYHQQRNEIPDAACNRAYKAARERARGRVLLRLARMFPEPFNHLMTEEMQKEE